MSQAPAPGAPADPGPAGRGVPGGSGPSSTVVVTMFETYGSGADYVAPRVAEALGLPFHPQAFSSEELEQEESRREKQGLLGRVLGAMGPAYAGVESRDLAAVQRDRYELTMANTRTVLEAAARGGVIVGRNGAFILSDRPRALHVLLDAPVEARVQRAARTRGIDVERARRRQRREDQARADMSIELYGWDPRELDRYHLVLNTGRLDLDACVAVVVAAARIRAGASA